MTMNWPALQNMRCLVTGGSSGIGRAIVKLLYDNGARIVTCARDPEHLEELTNEMGDGERLTTVSADISNVGGLDPVFDAVKAKLGGLDVLISNAAIAGESVFDTNEADIDSIIRTNLFAPIACVRKGLPHIEAGGRVLIIGSMSADVREEEGNVYVASKAGLQGFAGAFRKEANKHDIHVHLVEPGAVATPLHDLSDDELAEARDKGEMLVAEEVADCIAFILTRPPKCDIVGMQVRPHKQFV